MKSMAISHYFITFPKSDNKVPPNDYTSVQFIKLDGTINPYGENNKHAAYGGYIRDRNDPGPRPRPETNWLLEDVKDEVATAKQFGLDGFSVDILSTKDTSSPTSNWNRTVRVIDAAAAVGGFSVLLMPDMTAGFGTQSQTSFVSELAELAAKPGVMKWDDGRVIISPFKAEAKNAAWWTETFRQLKANYNIDCVFFPCFLNYYNSELANYVAMPQTVGLGNWGDRSPAATSNDYQLAADAHAKGKMWMQPVSVQDERPNRATFDEAANTNQLRTCFDEVYKAKAEWIQCITWNDYSEGAIFAPSTHHRNTYLQLLGYYIAKWKSGVEPTILKDAVFLTHRRQFVNDKQTYVAPVGITTTTMSLRAGSSPVQDLIEVVVFATAPGTLKLVNSATSKNFDVVPGFNVFTLPLAKGAAPVATLSRTGQQDIQVTTGYVVYSPPFIQDLQYVGATNVNDVYDWFTVNPVTTPVDDRPWAVVISPDPTSRIKALQGEVGVVQDGLFGNDTLTAIENYITSANSNIATLTATNNNLTASNAVMQSQVTDKTTKLASIASIATQ